MSTFENYLKNKEGTHKEASNDVYTRQKELSMYYYNMASDYHAGALVLFDVLSKESKITPEDLGLGTGFSFNASLPKPLHLVVGLSIELLLKAIARILDKNVLETHNLQRLLNHVGIKLNRDQNAIIDRLTSAIEWDSRYPTPKKKEQWENSIKVHDRAWSPVNKDAKLKIMRRNPKRSISLKNYQEIWDVLEKHYWKAKSLISED